MNSSTKTATIQHKALNRVAPLEYTELEKDYLDEEI
jgi:hypothetical protein